MSKFSTSEKHILQFWSLTAKAPHSTDQTYIMNCDRVKVHTKFHPAILLYGQLIVGFDEIILGGKIVDNYFSSRILKTEREN
mmetsp:Transcript_39141/g.34829  ORF Transcript_39141/g.34829 Transcript_39141/m.34829 type:complete len:82 (+) Transcript_39141:420-665(+)